MPHDASRPEYVSRQYRDGRRLAARHRLHADCSVAAEPFLSWLFAREAPAAGERLLEVGCGRGDLWVENADRIPAGVAAIVATDASPGMAAESQDRLEPLPIEVAVADAAALPFPAGCFDVVVANHMLYHVPDLAAAVGELHRVLRPGGKMHASTNGEGHMREMFAVSGGERPFLSFTLESAAGHLAGRFTDLRVERYPSSLRITEAAPAVDYVASYRDLDAAARSDLARRITGEIEAHGAFVVQKSVGLVSGRRGEV